MRTNLYLRFMRRKLSLWIKMASVTVTLSLQLLCQLIGPSPNSTLSICGTNVDRSEVQIANGTLPDGYIAYPHIGAAYKVRDEIVSWQVAERECILEGAQLALIDSWTKLNYVLHQRKSKNHTHVGIIRKYDDSHWIGLSTGSPVLVIPWAEGEPSSHWDCAMIKHDQNGLRNYPCTTRGDFVCELPIPPHQIVGINSAPGEIVIN